jgi:hypothetical protein
VADKLEDMDEELARARQKDGDDVDIYKHRRRYRLFKAILLGMSLAGLTWLVMAMVDGGANPCAKVRAYLCKKDPVGLPCKSYEAIVDESVHDSSPVMRSNVRSQCEQKIQRLKDEEGVDLK